MVLSSSKDIIELHLDAALNTKINTLTSVFYESKKNYIICLMNDKYKVI